MSCYFEIPFSIALTVFEILISVIINESNEINFILQFNFSVLKSIIPVTFEFNDKYDDYMLFSTEDDWAIIL